MFTATGLLSMFAIFIATLAITALLTLKTRVNVNSNCIYGVMDQLSEAMPILAEYNQNTLIWLQLLEKKINAMQDRLGYIEETTSNIAALTDISDVRESITAVKKDVAAIIKENKKVIRLFKTPKPLKSTGGK